MILILFSLLLAYWCNKEMSLFALRINRQCYQDYIYLTHSDILEQEFLSQSSLKEKMNHHSWVFYVVFPMVVFLDLDWQLSVIIMLLIFLSFLDKLYYLTDIRYIYIIFLLSLHRLIFSSVEDVSLYIQTLFYVSVFFIIFIPITTKIFKKESFGNGDVLLLCALSPLFHLDDFLLLLLLASLSGILFYGLFFTLKKRKLDKLPFIPFITSGYLFVLFYQN